MKPLFPLIGLNLVWWILVYFAFNYFLGYGSSNTSYVNTFSLFLLPVTVGLAYFVQWRLTKPYLLSGHYIKYGLYVAATFIIGTQAIILSVFYALLYLVDLHNDAHAPVTRGLPFIIMGVWMAVLVYTLADVAWQQYRAQQRAEHLKSQITEAQLRLREQELHYLRSQIQPHFLFNALNTIYGYALTKDDLAPEMILKLSALLDYVLYRVDRDRVPLDEEIQHLQDYLALEQMRFGDGLQVDATWPKASQVVIAPLLLIPLVENACKHGRPIDGQLTIDIQLELAEEGRLLFTISNTHQPSSAMQEGLGLSNIRKRLALLYPDRHRLSHTISGCHYIVHLELDLHEAIA